MNGENLFYMERAIVKNQIQVSYSDKQRPINSIGDSSNRLDENKTNHTLSQKVLDWVLSRM
jgi:hypothetical protein